MGDFVLGGFGPMGYLVLGDYIGWEFILVDLVRKRLFDISTYAFFYFLRNSFCRFLLIFLLSFCLFLRCVASCFDSFFLQQPFFSDFANARGFNLRWYNNVLTSLCCFFWCFL